jgi:hypothetical protein
MEIDMPNLLQVWKQWADAPPAPTEPQILLADARVLQLLAHRVGVVHWTKWEQCAQGFRLWDSNDCNLHTGLIPLPFVGDLQRAVVYVLLLNGGLSPTDYFGEFQIPAFREKLLANLRQDFSGTKYPFFPLDPEYSWHSGTAWWQKKLKHVAKRLCELAPASEEVVREVLAQRVCAIEQLPYHSRNFGIPEDDCAVIPSVQLACGFVQSLETQAVSGEKLIVAMRRMRSWGLSADGKNILEFSAGQARGAHLSTAKDDAAGHRVVEVLLPYVRAHKRSKG